MPITSLRIESIQYTKYKFIWRDRTDVKYTYYGLERAHRQRKSALPDPISLPRAHWPSSWCLEPGVHARTAYAYPLLTQPQFMSP